MTLIKSLLKKRAMVVRRDIEAKHGIKISSEVHDKAHQYAMGEIKPLFYLLIAAGASGFLLIVYSIISVLLPLQ